MALTSPQDDFFGSGYIGMNPYHQGAMDRLSRLQILDGIMTNQGSAGDPSGGRGIVPPAGAKNTSAVSTPYSGRMGGFGSAQGAMTYGQNMLFPNVATARKGDDDPAPKDPKNPPDDNHGCAEGSSWQQFEDGTWGCRPNGAGGGTGGGKDPGGTTGGSGPCAQAGNPPTCPTGYQVRCINGSWACIPVGAGGGDGFNPNSAPGISPDMGAIRNALQGYFLQSFGNKNNPYEPGFSLDTGVTTPQALQNMFNFSRYEIPTQVSRLDPAFGSAQSELGFNYAPNMNGLDSIIGSLMGGGGAQNAMQIAQTGGVPDITNALGAIRTKGLMDLEDTLAQTREQYGSLGLGAGSDVSEALARGASRGIADINSQQSQLIASIMSQGTQNRLGAINALSGLGGTAGNLTLGGIGAGTQAALGSAGVRNAAGGLINNLVGTGVGGYNAASQNLLGLGQLSLAQQQWQKQMEYQDWLRTQQFGPEFQAALAYSTAFPPTTGGGGASNAAILGGSAIAGGASILAAMLSDRKAKTNVKKLKGSVLNRLRELPLYKWSYAADPEGLTHMGPMAQDWKETFGVGDGTHIHPIDVVGVMLASMKDLAKEVRLATA